MKKQSRNLGTMMFLWFCFWGMVACQTSQKRDFEQIRIGMEKVDVVDCLGSPSRSFRTKGQDQWTYYFYEDHQKHEKVVYFEEGKAVYVGDPPKSSVEGPLTSTDAEAGPQPVAEPVPEPAPEPAPSLAPPPPPPAKEPDYYPLD